MRKISCIISCLIINFCVGILYLWSVYRTPVANYYNWDISSANLVSSFMIMAFSIGNLICGLLQSRVNFKKVILSGCILFCSGLIFTSFLTPETISLIYLTYSCMSGVGCGLVYGNTLFCVMRQLPEKRGLASGLAVSAFGLSTVVLAPVSRWLLTWDALGVQNVPLTFRILGIVFLFLTTLSCVAIYFSDVKTTQANENNRNLHTPLIQHIKTPRFYALFLTNLFSVFTWMILVPIINDLGLDKGLSTYGAFFTVSLSGVGSVMGRLGYASLSDRIGRTNTLVTIGVISCVAGLSLIFVQKYAFTLAILFLSSGYGGMASVLPALTADWFNPKDGAMLYGIILLTTGLASISGSFISNTLLQWFQSYNYTFLLGASSSLIGVLIMLRINRYQLKHESANN